MAKKNRKTELGSERPFADLDPALAQTVAARAKERSVPNANAAAEKAYVAGEGGRPASYTPALGQAASLASDNRAMAAGTADINNRVDAVRSGNTTPNWSGYLQGRGVSADKINRARSLNGQRTGSSAPGSVGQAMDPAQAQRLMRERERYQNMTGESIPDAAQAYGVPADTVGVSSAQQADPAYRARVDSAREASGLHQQRQAELEAIRQRVQDQRYSEALMNRGRGIQNRAAAAQGLRMDRIATKGLNPQDRASVISDRRGLESQERVSNNQLDANIQDNQAARTFEASQNEADRRTARDVATTRANAPAGNRGNVDEAARKRWADTAKGYDPILKDLAGRASEDEALRSIYQDALRGQQAIRQGSPFYDGRGDLESWATGEGLGPGDVFVMNDENGYPIPYTLEDDSEQ